MATTVFTPPSGQAQSSWDDPTVWSGGTVPSGADVDVLLAQSALTTVTVASPENYGIGSLVDDGQVLALEGTLTVAGNAQLQNDATLELEGGGIETTGGLTVDGQSEIGGNGEIVGPVVNGGSIVVLPTGTGAAGLFIDGAVTGNGALEIGSGSYPITGGYNLELGGADSAPVVFGALGGVLVLDQPQSFGGTVTPDTQGPGNGDIDDLGNPPPSDQVLLAGFSFATLGSATYEGGSAGGTLTVTASGGGSAALSFAGNLNASDFELSAGPTLNDGRSSLLVTVVPGLSAPTLALALANGGHAPIGIINSNTATVTGTVTSGTTVQLVADGSVSEGTAAVVSGTYTASLPIALAPGEHQLVAIASAAGDYAQSNPLSLLVLPSPVDGVTIAGVSSYQLASLLGEGAGTQFSPGTEAIELTDGVLSVGPDTPLSLVQRLYEGLLGRGGDTGGLTTFRTIINTDGPEAVATAMLDSPEYARLHGAAGATDDAGFVTMLYAGLLGRSPDPAGFAANVQVLAGGVSRGALAAAIANSPEAKAYLAVDTSNVWAVRPEGALVTQLFETGLDRAPDLGGLATFTAALAAGQTVQQVAAAITGSPEFMADHAGQSAAALVTSLYNDGLSRAPDPAGLQLWTAALAGGASAQAAVLAGIATSPEASAHLIRFV